MNGLWLVVLLAPQEPARLPEVPVVEAPEIPAVLRRDPRDLPRAEPGRWSAWTGSAPSDPTAEPSIDTRVGELMHALAETLEEGDLPRALELSYRVLEIEPDYPPALVHLGLVHFRLQRYGDAVVAYERFLEVAPGELEHTHALGHSYYSLGEYERAAAHYERILRVAPGSPEALRGLALSRMRLGDEDEALGLLQQALDLVPGDVEALLWIARLSEDRGDTAAASAHVEHALELAPFDPRLWYLRMRVLQDLGREEEAVAAEARWRELDTVSQELRALEGILRVHPRRFDLIARTVELQRSIGDVASVRAGLQRMDRARPVEVPLVDFRIYALDTLWSLEDREGAERAARALAEDCPDDLLAWKRLELHFGLTRDRVRQVQAGRRVRELEGR